MSWEMYDVSPLGTLENSPAIYCRDKLITNSEVPIGTAERGSVEPTMMNGIFWTEGCRPYRTEYIFVSIRPGNKLPGYFQMSLRDRKRVPPSHEYAQNDNQTQTC